MAIHVLLRNDSLFSTKRERQGHFTLTGRYWMIRCDEIPDLWYTLKEQPFSLSFCFYLWIPFLHPGNEEDAGTVSDVCMDEETRATSVLDFDVCWLTRGGKYTILKKNKIRKEMSNKLWKLLSCSILCISEIYISLSKKISLSSLFVIHL